MPCPHHVSVPALGRPTCLSHLHKTWSVGCDKGHQPQAQAGLPRDTALHLWEATMLPCPQTALRTEHRKGPSTSHRETLKVPSPPDTM